MSRKKIALNFFLDLSGTVQIQFLVVVFFSFLVLIDIQNKRAWILDHVFSVYVIRNDKGGRAPSLALPSWCSNPIL